MIVYKIVGIEKVKAERFGRTDSEEAKRIQEGEAPEISIESDQLVTTRPTIRLL